MTHEGPSLESLLHRLAECPSEFLEPPLLSTGGIIHTAAVVSDLLRDLGGVESFNPRRFGDLGATPSSRPANRPPPLPGEGARLQLSLIACWLLHDSWFREQQRFAAAALKFLTDDVPRLSEFISPALFVSNADRREELVRVCLKALDLRPAGETIAQAQDRLTTLDSLELRRVLQDTRAAEERARAIRETLARKAAQEAAAKVTRE